MISKPLELLLFVTLCIGAVLAKIRANNGKDLSCKESRPLGCPEVMCHMMNSRKSDICRDVQCNGVTQDDCFASNSSFIKGLAMCGCCPACAKYIDVGEPCEVWEPEPSLDPNCTDPFCPIIMNRCKPGLVCNILGGSSKVCALPALEPPPPEEGGEDDNDEEDKESCEYKKNLGLEGKLHWTPKCEPDGSYSPVQCKGNTDEIGVCFCVDAAGNRLFGREWKDKAANQTCACSRRVSELRAEGNIAAHHCSPDGNYEPLQCDFDSGLCYCVDPQTGKLNGAVLPEHQWKLLPCYSYNLTNWDDSGRYLRICESEWVAGQRMAKEALMHGLKALSAKDLNCDYDGSYAPVRRVKALAYCTTKTGTLSPYFQEIDKAPMDCQCYRDSLLYTEEGRNFMKVCEDQTGNYAITSPYIDSQDRFSCVDRDGFFFGDIVEKRYTCCLVGDCREAPEAVRNMCYNPATDTGLYHACSHWPH